MVKNLDAHGQLNERERWQALAQMSVAESIAVGEALLTSELLDFAVFPDDDHPVSLARALGIRTDRDRACPPERGVGSTLSAENPSGAPPQPDKSCCDLIGCAD
ncbi:MAG: hypothetical protein JW940_21975 [Polyangiaceae bacterium]|nr:hypothetical protein [Polyangiaceae bacterium]